MFGSIYVSCVAFYFLLPCVSCVLYVVAWQCQGNSKVHHIYVKLEHNCRIFQYVLSQELNICSLFACILATIVLPKDKGKKIYIDPQNYDTLDDAVSDFALEIPASQIKLLKEIGEGCSLED